MDPNANLTEQLELAKRLLEDHRTLAADAERLAELVLALNGWIIKSGCLPAAWLTKMINP